MKDCKHVSSIDLGRVSGYYVSLSRGILTKLMIDGKWLNMANKILKRKTPP